MIASVWWFCDGFVLVMCCRLGIPVVFSSICFVAIALSISHMDRSTDTNFSLFNGLYVYELA